MSRFELVRDPGGNAELERIYAELKQAGLADEAPINWFTSQAVRPDILQATWLLTERILVEGLLPQSLKQMIAACISKHSNCRYCTRTHTRALEALGISREVIDGCLLHEDLRGVPLQYRTILRFAVKAAKNPNTIQDEDFQTLKDNGLNQKEIMEIVMLCSFMNFVNTWAEVSAIEID